MRVALITGPPGSEGHAQAFNAPPGHYPDVALPGGCEHCGGPRTASQGRFCSPACRLADWEDRNPRLREGATLAEVRAVLRRYLSRRFGRGRFQVRH